MESSPADGDRVVLRRELQDRLSLTIPACLTDEDRVVPRRKLQDPLDRTDLVPQCHAVLDALDLKPHRCRRWRSRACRVAKNLADGGPVSRESSQAILDPAEVPEARVLHLVRICDPDFARL